MKNEGGIAESVSATPLLRLEVEGPRAKAKHRRIYNSLFALSPLRSCHKFVLRQRPFLDYGCASLAMIKDPAIYSCKIHKQCYTGGRK